MNALDDVQLSTFSFAYNDIIGQDRWSVWTPVFGSLTVVGATSYAGRFRVVGRSCQFQVQFSAATSIASAAGTDYLTLPIKAAGYAGLGIMMNATTKIAVGICSFDIANSRCYIPMQLASANVFTLAGEYEI